MTAEKTTSGVKPDDVIARSDGYANLITGLQLASDKNRADFFSPDRTLQPTELANMYEQDAICRRIVDRVVDDATRTKIHLKSINQPYDFERLESKLEDLDVLGSIGAAWKWGRLFGGGLVIMAVNDGVMYDEPLNLQKARAITGLSVLDSSTCWPRDWNPRLGSKSFAEPGKYEVIVPFVGGEMRNLHASRVIRIDGCQVPPSRLMQRGGWPPSVLQGVWREVTQLGKSMGYAANLLNEMSLMVMSIDGWREMICGGPAQVDMARQMLQNFKWSADNLHMIGIDKADTFQEVKRSADGVALLVDRFVEALVRSTDMPRLILLGEQPGGLNADAKGEVRAWYDYVASQQQQVLTPAINRILEVEFAIAKREGQAVPTEWTIEYSSLYPMAPETQASTLAAYATAAQTLITAKVCTPMEVRAKLVELNLLKPVDGAVDTTQLGQPASEREQLALPPAPIEAGDEEELEAEPVLVEATHLPPAGETLMSPKDIGIALGVGAGAIKAMHARGEIDGWRIGNRWRYALSQVTAASHHPAGGVGGEGV